MLLSPAPVTGCGMAPPPLPLATARRLLPKSMLPSLACKGALPALLLDDGLEIETILASLPIALSIPICVRQADRAMAEVGGGDGFRGLPFQMSLEDIDHLLTSDSDIRRSSLWVPQRTRDSESSSAAEGNARHARGGARGGVHTLGLSPHGGHGQPSSGPGAGAGRLAVAASPQVAYEMGQPGERGELPTAAPSYGAVHGSAPGEGSLPARYKRIEKVALSIGAICSMVFVVSLSGGGGITGSSSSSSTLAGRGQNKASGSGADCGAFLCPSSGQCVAGAGKCLEGNPFLKANSVYRALIECADATELCNHAAGAASVEFKDKKVATVLAAQGRGSDGKFKACDGFLCPKSGSCQISPANCTEGDPFASHASLYWKQAVAAKALLQHTDTTNKVKAMALGDRKSAAEAAGKHGVKGGEQTVDTGGSAAANRLFHGNMAAKVAAMAVPKKLSAKQLEQQEVKSEAASLEKSDAASKS